MVLSASSVWTKRGDSLPKQPGAERQGPPPHHGHTCKASARGKGPDRFLKQVMMRAEGHPDVHPLSEGGQVAKRTQHGAAIRTRGSTEKQQVEVALGRGLWVNARPGFYQTS